MKAIQKLAVGGAGLFATIIVVLVIGYAMLRSAPQFYRRAKLSPEQAAAAAENAERTINAARQKVALAHASERQRTTNPSIAVEPLTMTFSAAELNSFFDKWADVSGWKAHWQPYLSEPEVFLSDGRVILAGDLKEVKTLVSLHFRPELDEKGQLRLNLVKVLGGRLPLPDMVLAPQKEKLESALRNQLPNWQDGAKISSTGTANLDAVAAAMSKLLLAGLENKSADSTFFLPLDYTGRKNVPVKLTKLSVDDKGVTLTAVPLNSDEREQMIKRIRGQ
jgi:exonuclease VII small subunit